MTHRRTTLLTALFALALAARAALAQGPTQVHDVNTAQTGGVYLFRFWDRAQGAGLGGVGYFSLDDGIHGNELWRSDGTFAGTWMVRDICPGSCSSGPKDFAVLGNALYFQADDGVHGPELWRSDGTAVGTGLVADIVPGLAGSAPVELMPFAGGLIFVAWSPAAGHELWRSDGTSDGTALVLDIEPGGQGSLISMLVANSTGVFFTADDEDHGGELWSTDGTAAGTKVLEVAPGPASGVSIQRGQRGYYGLAGERLVFYAHGSPSPLWQSDGTAAGTTALPHPSPFTTAPAVLPAIGGQVFLVIADNELWKTDGTPVGTVPVEAMAADARISSWQATTLPGRLVFLVFFDSSGDWALWTSDGTPEGTSVAVDLPGTDTSSPWEIASLGEDRFVFYAQDATHGREPWISDGTTDGTSRLADVFPGPGSSYDIFWQLELAAHDPVDLGDRHLVRLFDDDGNLELWRLDPTQAVKVREVNDQTSSVFLGIGNWFGALRPFGVAGETLVFQATDGVSGLEPWRSDGTAAGTTMLADLVAGGGSVPLDVTSLGADALFLADGAVWRTDGSPGDLQQLAAPPSGAYNLIAVGDRAFFDADGPDPGWQALWSTDGTPGGTGLVPGAPHLYGGWAHRVGYDGRLAFATADDTSGLWLSDASASGTVPVPGAPQVDWPHMAVADGQLFFAGTDLAGQELWVYDGDSAARRVVDLDVGPASGIPAWRIDLNRVPPRKIAAVGSRAIVLATDGGSGEEPWVSDGTEPGTFLLADVFPGPRSSDADELTSTGDRAFFVADDAVHGRELWTTDGTAAGTRLVLDIVPGTGSSIPRHLAAVGDRIVFTAWTPSHGAEAWVSDGTPEGTFRVGDIAPGPASSSPVHFVANSSLVFFAANDNVTGFEPWALPRQALASTPTAFHTLTPCRVFDSRESAPITAATRRIPVSGRCGIPATARAVAANVTVTRGTADGHLALQPALGIAPALSVGNFTAGQTRAQQVILRPGFGEIDARAVLAAPGDVHVIVDVTGWFE